MFYRTSIEVKFNSDESTTATMILSDGTTDVPGTASFSEDGKTGMFTPDADLTPSTTYTLTVAYSCEKTADIGFTTSDVGSAVDADTIIGNVYLIDLGSARITQPAGVGGLLTPLIADADFNLGVSPASFTSPNIAMTGALFDEVEGALEQNLCYPSLTLDDADYTDDPFFSLSGSDTIFSILDITIQVARLNLSGAFAPDGASIQGVALDITIDTTQLADLDLGLDLGEGDDICSLLGNFGVECEDCGDGTVTCLTVVADSIIAEQEVGATIIEVSDQDVADNVDCDAVDTDAGQ